MYKVKGSDITLTRGDTFKCEVRIKYHATGEEYVPNSQDTIRFAMKRDYHDKTCAVVKTIPANTMLLTIDPSDTKSLPFGDYVYDIQLTNADGEVSTFLSGKLNLTEEVY